MNSFSFFRSTALALTLALLAGGPLLMAGKIGGVTLPDNMKIENQDLVLNGAGLRKKLFIKVYAGGLYVKAKSKDAAAVVKADEPMVVRMHFIYNGVSASKLTTAWNDGFKAATGGKTEPIQKHIDAFNALFTGEAKKNDVYDVIYVPGKGVELKVNGSSKGTVSAGIDFKQALFGIWLGDKPADSGLKKGMMGK
ncbi:Chalcone isomerase family protein [Sulfidibacter corallicola]|uniref:Chalcone isomerase family protein n=1 Tax=Sulfidibacter corallicola TaxID=2818388 RepID=A0A8A4TWZ0_SULCO|nr:chalcone isomerase family protein [Sulfidibacter corallicola]QTD53993.1 chalcone isomerase family protein [Sulfidibacter corallicola]